ncbi:MAG: flagellar biosynthesis anti-sigma factor FlgM [Aquabacterium sp.]
MKLGPIDPKSITMPAVDRKEGQAQRGGGPAAPPTAAPGVTVSLSPVASLLSATPAEGDFDAAKVDRVAREIREGRFQVNADAIADKLIANAQELLSRSHKA